MRPQTTGGSNGVGSAVINSASQLGGSLGIAIMGTSSQLKSA